MIYSSSSAGAKYNRIYNALGIHCVQINHIELLKVLKSKKMCKDVDFYHLRYLNLDSISKYGFYLVLPIFLKLRNIRLVWTVHNIEDHQAKNLWLNKFLNYYLVYTSYKSVVMHSYLKKKFPKRLRRKITIAHFGPLAPEDVSTQLASDQKNINLLNKFIEKKAQSVVLFSISTASKNQAYKLSNYVSDECLLVFVDPKGIFKNKICKSNNTLYIAEKVGTDFLNHLKKIRFSFGVVGHDNGSVATSVYLFATMKIPILALDYAPNSHIVEKNNIGYIYKNDNNLEDISSNLKINYEEYTMNTTKFTQKHSWKKTIKIHKKIFR